MDALVICGVLAVVACVATLAYGMWRRRADQRLQWLGTRERDWSTEDLEVLRSADVV